MKHNPGDTKKAKGVGPTEVWIHSPEPGNICLPLASPRLCWEADKLPLELWLPVLLLPTVVEHSECYRPICCSL